jgi:hypothetical protein
MSGATNHVAVAHPSWRLDGAWANAWKAFAGAGVVGILGAGAGYASDPRRFAFSWLFAFVTFLSIALGATFFVLIQRLTSAGWSVTVRRTAEFFSVGVLALIPLFLPVLVSMTHLFPWLSHGEDHGAATHSSAASLTVISEARAAEEHGDVHGSTPTAHEPGVSAHGEPQVSEHSAGASREHAQHAAHGLIRAEVLTKKSPYLNRSFFYVRALLYFAIWALLATRLFGYSAAQDVTKNPQLTLRAQAFASPGTFLFGLSLTFAAFDWIMSLEPTWFSTIFGVYFFSTGVVSSLAVIILVTMALRTAGPLRGAITVEHYHDLGKLMFGFLVFWAYIGFSQFMLIWYAALPEETSWYHNRWDFAPWSTVTVILVLGHFVIPFFWTMSRNFKRNLSRLQLGAAVIFVMHIVDMYWLVMPNYHLGKDGFTFSWIDVACLCAVGGIYGAFVFHRMTKHSLVPVGDPRLKRSLHFQNA